MSRSIKKGAFVDAKLLKKVKSSTKNGEPIKTWSRSSTVIPEMIGYVFLVHNGKKFIEVRLTEEMVGHRLGEFVSTVKFERHGGKIQRELEKKAKEREIEERKKEKAKEAAN